ncbi:hypothetical protein GIB67_004497 [Kingdonia uniflora]|uniref:Phytocyanin domain-containing protein n=1 Tax=Kingdonia uniflora TaxID=39325 RepID=A0A7J7MRJ0_9MAGN|nr:hypothetical protein GIB67_004497 [Kingdonia uniflora]
MASLSSKTALLVFFALVCSLHCNSVVSSVDFEVGQTKGWVVPASNESEIYNTWASKNRFQIGDSVHFKYEKDSVMLVTETEYKHCNTTHPFFFSNNGNTVYTFDRWGLFYFISGVSGHCERGQRMIIKVLALDDGSSGGDGTSGGVPASRVSSAFVFLVVVLSPVVGSFVF